MKKEVLANPSRFSNQDTKEFEVADKVEGLIKNTFSKIYLNQETQNIQWLRILKFLLAVNLVLTYFNLFVRSDFVNILVTGYIFVIILTTLSTDVIRNLNNFLISLAIALIYDILWFMFKSSVKSL
jgi:hypothetical protein